MRINFKITKKQAEKIASDIYSSDFRCYGLGNFNISVDEFSELIMKSFNEDKKSCGDFYSKLLNKYMY
jgi:hypothetical protein